MEFLNLKEENNDQVNKQMQRIYLDYNDDSDDEINLRELFEKYSCHWKWFLFGLLLALALAFTYLRYTHKKYQVSTVFIEDKDSGGMPSELEAFSDLGILSDQRPTGRCSLCRCSISNSICFDFGRIVFQIVFALYKYCICFDFGRCSICWQMM